MAYITKTDLEDRFGAPEILKLQGGTENAPFIAAVIADADALINMHLAARYTVPFSPVPTFIIKLDCDIARFFLYDDSPSDAVKAAYDNAISILQKLASGQLYLDATVYPATDTASPDYDAGVLQFDDLTGY